MLTVTLVPLLACLAVARAAWTCPNALTVELAYRNELPLSLSDGTPLTTQIVTINYEPGNRQEWSLELTGIYNEGESICWYQKSSSESELHDSPGMSNDPRCRAPVNSPMPTGGYARRALSLPNRRQADPSFPDPLYVCHVEFEFAAIAISPVTPTDNSLQCELYDEDFSMSTFCNYDPVTGELNTDPLSGSSANCPTQMCPAIYTRKRSLESFEITRRQVNPAVLRGTRLFKR